MRVTLFQLPATWGDPSAALALVDAELTRDAATDLVLLPEASLTGYVSPDGDFDLSRFAERADGRTALALGEIAKRHRVNLVAPLVLEESGALFNAMVAWDRDGKPIFTYRKRHPWFPETWATEGPSAAPSVVIDGLRVTIAICFDVHFLEEDARAALDAADVLLFPSAWVEEVDTRPTMLAAIAQRHRIAVANANWGDGIVRIAGQGSSSILDAEGRVLARASVGAGLRGLERVDAIVEVTHARG